VHEGIQYNEHRVLVNTLSVAVGHASWFDRVGCVQLLLDNRADANYVCPETGRTSLTIAASRSSLACMRLLLEHGADPNLLNGDGATALMLRCYRNHAGSVKQLINAKALVNTKHGPSQSCAVSNAALYGNPEVSGGGCMRVRVSVSMSASNNLPLSLSTQVLRVLVDCKAFVDPRDLAGDTPLLMAANRDTQPHRECVHLLADAGALVNATNDQGECVLGLMATQEGFAGKLWLDSLHLLLRGAKVVGESRLQGTQEDALDTMRSRQQRLVRGLHQRRTALLVCLMDEVAVDTRVGRGDGGLYHEPLERAIEYCGFSLAPPPSCSDSDLAAAQSVVAPDSFAWTEAGKRFMRMCASE
jgi:hypothetical protein